MSDLGADDLTAERVARNDAIFRAANEQISDTAAEQQMHDGVPLLCECCDPTCKEILTLSLSEYEEIRADSRRFLNVPGHDKSAGPHVRVVARTDRYFVVQKVGRAAEVVAELDPRARA